MRISDWSSDVCSSDLVGFGADRENLRALLPHRLADARVDQRRFPAEVRADEQAHVGVLGLGYPRVEIDRRQARSEERRVGKECVSTCRSRWSPSYYKKQYTTHSSSSYYFFYTS